MSEPDMKLLILIVSLVCAAGLRAEASPPRVVSAGGAVTEIIFALNGGKDVVGTDISSVYPEAATRLPQIGYIRMLSAEGILSLKPTLLITTDEAGPPEAMEQIKGIGLQVLQLSSEHTVPALEERILKIGSILKAEPEAKKLVAQLQDDLKAAAAKVATQSDHPKVLFIYARGGGVMNVAGTNTSADAVIRLAGGINAAASYEGYKPLTAEAAVDAAPDVILITTRGLGSAGGIDELLKQPGLALTPAGKNRRVVVMDDLYLLGFGPRLGKAASDLCDSIHIPATASSVAAVSQP
jgi:iron complex transport system substrate-binding protein